MIKNETNQLNKKSYFNPPPFFTIKKIGFSRMGVISLIVIALLPLIPPFNQEHMIRWLITGTFLAAQAIAFDFTSGYINVVNFGFAAFVGLGAYTSAILSNTLPTLVVQPGISPWLTIWIGALVAGLLGFGLGVLTLRLRGIYAACLAWFLGIALMGIARNLVGLTRGSMGLHPPRLIDSSSNLPYFYVIFSMLLITYISLKIITITNIGLAFKAIGQNLDVARASGINATKYRVLNFTVSCFFAGLLGGFYAHYLASLTPDTVMHTSKTVEVMAMVYIGGRGSLWGGAAVAFPFVFLIELLKTNLEGLPGLQLVLFGFLMIFTMIYYPGGFSAFYNNGINTLMVKLRGLSKKTSSIN